MVEQALQNTIMGISIVFCMLALISILIYCFRIIPYLREKFSKKDSPDPKPEEYMDIRLLVPEPTEDERELVAVIAAAIAASEAISTDDFVVRSIRRRY
ncbi:MAG: OadG family protein [Lachnospiraceae bacterium]|nr:OadG family protein [Lachnospiraceae bacterium]